MTFVLCTVIALLLPELHKNGLSVSERKTGRLEDSPCSGQTVQVNEENLKTLIEEDPCQATRKLAENLGCTHVSVARHLHSIGKIQKLGQWISHALHGIHYQIMN